MGKMKFAKMACLALGFCMMAAISNAQTFTLLYTFANTTGYGPMGELVQGFDGNLYGTTLAGGGSSACNGDFGATGCGTVFKTSFSGKVTILHSFDSADGGDPFDGLAQRTTGSLYGTTRIGGANNYGTVFSITQQGTLTTMYSFCSQAGCADGINPWAGLVEGLDGSFYGTTWKGGGSNLGTVFKITPGGKLTNLHSFDGTDGQSVEAGLIQGGDGNFYGITLNGGASNYGTVFKITPRGMFTTLYNFCSLANCADGGFPRAALLQASDGNLYGPVQFGSLNGSGGAIFKITPSGVLTRFYTFCSQPGCADGTGSDVSLVQATDGNFYGTTGGGGANNGGTVFKITPAGVLTTLYNFCSESQTNCAEEYPNALFQATDGNFYGTTQGDISSSCSPPTSAAALFTA